MLWVLISIYFIDIIIFLMGDEVFIFKEKFDRLVVRFFILVKIL